MTQPLFHTRGSSKLRERCWELVTEDRLSRIDSTLIRMKRNQIGLFGLLKLATRRLKRG